MALKDFEMVIGLEVHVELKTATKIFCGCSTAFGAPPNTQCCPVCTGMPGSLPVLNRQVVNYAVKAGVATNCTIAGFSKQDRKNYFYPDLPKAYQISQYDLPLCEHGWLEIETEKKGKKRIGITRIHIEEDAGKLVHVDGQGTLVDCNRCGVPLIEIVSEPDIRSSEEAKAYLQKLRAIIMYTDVSDCKMNEGSLRCDVNLSVRKKGEQAFGTRTEMKNLNSFQFIVKAIEYEFERQVKAVESGEEIIQETRRFDPATGKTSSMRRKENADDYRYFPDPDLAPIEVTAKALALLKDEIPALPDARKAQYMEQWGISAYGAEQLVSVRAVADYFEAAAAQTQYPQLVANIILSDVLRLLPQDEAQIPIAATNMAKLATLAGDGVINSSICKQLVQQMWQQDADPAELVAAQGLAQISDEAILLPLITDVLAANDAAVHDYKNGKTNALQAIVGQIMRSTKGRGNPVKINRMVLKIIESQTP